MTKKFHILYLIALIGFFMIPNQSVACSMKSTTKSQCIKKEKTTTIDDCCKSHSDKKEGCTGKCKHRSCQCSPTITLLFSENNFHDATNCFDFSNTKPSFATTQIALSSGYYTIWDLPKIS